MNLTQEQLPFTAAGEELKTESEETMQARNVYDLFETNASEIISLLNEKQTHKYDDIEMSYVRFPTPFKSTSENLIKRENDVISGNIAFNTDVRIG